MAQDGDGPGHPFDRLRRSTIGGLISGVVWVAGAVIALRDSDIGIKWWLILASGVIFAWCFLIERRMEANKATESEAEVDPELEGAMDVVRWWRAMSDAREALNYLLDNLPQVQLDNHPATLEWIATWNLTERDVRKLAYELPKRISAVLANPNPAILAHRTLIRSTSPQFLNTIHLAARAEAGLHQAMIVFKEDRTRAEARVVASRAGEGAHRS